MNELYVSSLIKSASLENRGFCGKKMFWKPIVCSYSRSHVHVYCWSRRSFWLHDLPLDGGNTVYHVYRALAANGMENAQFSEVGGFAFDKDFQGVGLVTEETTNDNYLVGLWPPTEGATFADYAYLYQLNTETWTIGEELDQIHMVSVGGVAGMMGVHFRYGANVYVADDGTLTLSDAERNSVSGSALVTNDWTPVIAD